MDASLSAAARASLHDAVEGKKSFPGIVSALMEAGFESYLIDFRRAMATFFLPDGESIDVEAGYVRQSVMPNFDADAIQAAIRDAQRQSPGYTYAGFCARVAAAGCAGYMVSFAGRRALYFGRTAETLTEPFPA